MCFTFFAAQGKPIGDSLFEPDQVDTCRRILAEHADKVHLPEDIVGLDADGVFSTWGTSLPDRRQGLRHRPGFGGGVQRHRDGRPDGVLERPDGHVRGRPLRGRHAHPRPGDGRHQGVHRRRRRRHAPRRWPSSVSTTTSTTSRPAAAPASSCSSSATSPASPHSVPPPTPRRMREEVAHHVREKFTQSQAAHLGQLEDEPQPLRGDPDGAEAAVPGAEGRLRDGRRQHPPAVHRHPLGADGDRGRRPRHAARRAALPLRGQGCVHRRDLAGVPRQARREVRGVRAQRTPRHLRRDRRDGEREGEGDPASTA